MVIYMDTSNSRSHSPLTQLTYENCISMCVIIKRLNKYLTILCNKYVSAKNIQESIYLSENFMSLKTTIKTKNFKKKFDVLLKYVEYVNIFNINYTH